MNTATFPYKVRRTLTTDDRLQIGSDLAAAAAKLNEVARELKAIKEQFKSRESAAEEIMQNCQEALNRGWRMTEIPCYWEMDYPSYGLKSIIRTDTGEAVSREAMSNSDRQEVLVFEDPQEATSEQPQAGSAEGQVEDAATEISPDVPGSSDPNCTLTGPGGEILFEGKSRELHEAAERVKHVKSGRQGRGKAK
jgi:hypothetical protein